MYWKENVSISKYGTNPNHVHHLFGQVAHQRQLCGKTSVLNWKTISKWTVHIRKEWWCSMNRDEGSYTLSHTYDRVLATSHHYCGKNWKKNWTSLDFFKNWRILLVQSFTACIPLLTATSAFRLGRRRWNSPPLCYLHCPWRWLKSKITFSKMKPQMFSDPL